MIRTLTFLMHLVGTSCVRIGSRDEPHYIVLGKQYYVVEEHSEGGNLLAAVEAKKYRYSQFVEYNLQRLVSRTADFDVYRISKEGPDWTGFMKYTIKYLRLQRPVFSLYYTVKKNVVSWDDTYLFRSGRFLKDSVIDLFPTHEQESDFDCTIIGIRTETCWPRQLSPYAFCLFEVQFKHPLLLATNEAEVDGTDVNRRYTTEYKGEYDGIYVQVNGKDVFDQYDLKLLPTGQTTQVCSLHIVGTGTTSPAVYFLQDSRDPVSFIFGGVPADYIASLEKDGNCVADHGCTVEIAWGVTKDGTINNFAIQKSVERANQNLTLLSSSILQDGWRLTQISNRAQEAH